MDLNSKLDAGQFLVAVPQLGDPNFARSVVFLLEHTDEGSMGVVLTRGTEVSLEHFCESQGFVCQEPDPQEFVHIGGPVQADRALLIHSQASAGPETESIGQGLYLSYSVESLENIAKDPPKKWRVFLGYAGWGPEQLASEIAEGSWLVAPADPTLVFGPDGTDPWSITLAAMGIDPAQLMHSSQMH